MRLWPAVKAARLFVSAEEFEDYRMTGPWRVRVSESGDAMVLGAWREHLRVLSVRGLWAPATRMRPMVDEACSVARTQGFDQVISPPVPGEILSLYLDAGMEVLEPLVAFQAVADRIAEGRPPVGVHLRRATARDAVALLEIDASSFTDFWRYGPAEMLEALRHERIVLAEDAAGSPLGYSAVSTSRGAATLSRLAVAPAARRSGLGRALVGEAAAFSARNGALTLALCTQGDNEASKALYRSTGMQEVADRYALAARRI